MKRFVAKTLLLIPFIVLFVFIISYLIVNDNTRPSYLSFEVSNSKSRQIISAWYDEDFKTYYAFLPSFADVSDILVVKNDAYDITIDDFNDKNILLGNFYDVKISNKPFKLCFLKASSTAAVFIDTESGNMERIHADKDYKETVSVKIYDEQGALNYSAKKDKLKGRGNSTWQYDKKPYVLTLSNPSEILSMPKSDKWILLANGNDTTNLRNKLIYDIAHETGMEWTPDSRYVDVYLNGSYNGLYLLTEKIEVGENRLSINVDGSNKNTDFLCKIDLVRRWDDLNNPFLTKNNRAVEIVAPENVNIKTAAQISSIVNNMEQSIMSDDDSLPDNIDLDSFVKKYIIDEISENADADLASSYFYCKYKNNQPVIYAGPLWDYDQTFGIYWESTARNGNPRAFMANTGYITPDESAPYYKSLYKKKGFYDRVAELYKEQFLPVLNDYLSTKLSVLEKSISDSAYMNIIRWKTENGLSTEALRSFLSERVAFLNEAWVNKQEFYTVQIKFKNTESFIPYSVKSGESVLSVLGGVQADLQTFNDFETGEKFDLAQPVTKDATLISTAEIKTGIKISAMAELKAFLRQHFSEIVIIACIFFIAGIILYVVFHEKLLFVKRKQ